MDGDGEYAQFQISSVYFIALLMKTGFDLCFALVDFICLIDAIPEADAAGVYDIILVIIVFSIFLLPPLRMLLEYQKRQETYQKYLKSSHNITLNNHSDVIWSLTDDHDYDEG